MKTDKPTVMTTADAPFHDPTNSVDLVIRTADDVNFFVLGGLLSLQSPSSFFRHVLQGNRYTEERDGFPVLLVEELSTTIKIIEDVSAIGDGLEKYCMDYAIEPFKRIVTTSVLIRDQALQLFIRAIQKGWRSLGEAAAKNTLCVPLNKEVAIGELNLQNMVEVKMRGDNGGRKVKIHGWTSGYIREVSQKLRATPRPEIAMDRKLISWAFLSSGVQCLIDNWKDIARGRGEGKDIGVMYEFPCLRGREVPLVESLALSRPS
ncbi:hypothetical protein IW262DRAFT_1290992 [Armillaria fumosa]|nr:hypothetical protein IW262DRAFT_1290992 [Armillaria fumosa]